MQKYTQEDTDTLQRYIKMSQAYRQLAAFDKRIGELSSKVANSPEGIKAIHEEMLQETQEAHQKFQNTVKDMFPDISPSDFPKEMQKIEEHYFADLQRDRQPDGDSITEKAYSAMQKEKSSRVAEMYRQAAEGNQTAQQQIAQRDLQAQKDALWDKYQRQQTDTAHEQKIGAAKDRLIQTAPPALLDEMAYDTQKKISDTNKKLRYCTDPIERTKLVNQRYEEGIRLEKIHQRIQEIERQQEKDREDQSRSR